MTEDGGIARGRRNDRRQIEFDEVVEAPVLAPGARWHRSTVAAKVRDEHVEARRRERVREAIGLARTEVATVRHHRVQAYDRTAPDSDAGHAIDAKRDAV